MSIHAPRQGEEIRCFWRGVFDATSVLRGYFSAKDVDTRPETGEGIRCFWRGVLMRPPILRRFFNSQLRRLGCSRLPHQNFESNVALRQVLIAHRYTLFGFQGTIRFGLGLHEKGSGLRSFANQPA